MWRQAYVLPWLARRLLLYRGRHRRSADLILSSPKQSPLHSADSNSVMAALSRLHDDSRPSSCPCLHAHAFRPVQRPGVQTGVVARTIQRLDPTSFMFRAS